MPTPPTQTTSHSATTAARRLRCRRRKRSGDAERVRRSGTGIDCSRSRRASSMLAGRVDGQELHRLFLVVVATSAMRHEVRNKLGTLRNASFYIRRKVEGSEAWKEDVRVPRFFQIIETEIASIDQIVTAGVAHVL